MGHQESAPVFDPLTQLMFSTVLQILQRTRQRGAFSECQAFLQFGLHCTLLHKSFLSVRKLSIVQRCSEAQQSALAGPAFADPNLKALSAERSNGI